MKKSVKVQFIEIVDDAELRKKEREVNETLARLQNGCGPVKLYRTADGRIGFQVSLRAAAGDRKRVDEVYRLIMRAIGERRGRPAGLKTRQVKLRLPEPAYAALKQAASDSSATMSQIVARLAMRELAEPRRASRSAGQGKKGASNRRLKAPT